MLVIDTLALGPVVDYFVAFAGNLDIHDPTMLFCMHEILTFGSWFYYLIFLCGCTLILYLPVYTIKRHRYMDVEPSMVEEQAF